MSNELPYSYHTFLFPFIWKTEPEITLGKFEEILQIGKNWTERKWDVMMQAQDVSKDEKKKDEWFQNYAAYQYFTTAANNAIFNADGKGVVKCYVFNKQNGTYSVHKRLKIPFCSEQTENYRRICNEAKHRIYGKTLRIVRNLGKDTVQVCKRYKCCILKEQVLALKINQIRLNVYEAGIAIMIFELEYNPESESDRTLDNVNKINEYGRRINFPFLMESSHLLCADWISVQFDGSKEIKEDFLGTAKNIKKHIQGDEKGCRCSLNYVMKPIQDILDGGQKIITSNPAHRDKYCKFLIKPCTDDRMFVCCAIQDAALSQELKGVGSEGISFLKDVNVRKADGDGDETTLSSRLYKLIFVENRLTCQDNTMKQELLKACVYRRWINYGTVHGMTHHSFVMVNNGKDIPSINAFLTEYVQMAILALAQRSVLLMLEDEAAEISNSFSDENVISHEELEEIERLQEKYVKIQNQLLLSEITVQEQGVELYEMLREQLYIKKNMDDLDGEMNNLRDISNIANARLERQSDADEENKFNMLGLLMGLLALVEPLAMIFTKNDEDCWEGLVWFFISIIVVAVILFKYRPFKKRK